jgi:phosphoribosylformimino-5-aminoimidazole carboxamide ribotide isomerase
VAADPDGASFVPFDVIPAIDLRGGSVVRLRGGDFAQETAYGDDAVAVALEFARAGARWIHVVDLDGARAGMPQHRDVIAAVAAGLAAADSATSIEVAGGLRTAESAASALAAGAARIVVGTAALRDPGFAAAVVASFGADRVAVAIDVRDGLAIGEGWRVDAPGVPADVAVERLADVGVVVFEVTAISRDGLLEGPDVELLTRLVALNRGAIIASGGVSSLADLQLVADHGCAGAIVGRAIYEGRIDLRAAVELAAGLA